MQQKSSPHLVGGREVVFEGFGLVMGEGELQTCNTCNGLYKVGKRWQSTAPSLRRGGLLPTPLPPTSPPLQPHLSSVATWTPTKLSAYLGGEKRARESRCSAPAADVVLPRCVPQARPRFCDDALLAPPPTPAMADLPSRLPEGTVEGYIVVPCEVLFCSHCSTPPA